ncbi:hypothetical protein K440DRAFT_634182 [Wilcoxina mikolae CBS 423.85]|nr:hypothetical protein K440DRAFT_634182 [Wilcoxina mikolae CBS 423.85]
MTSGAVKRDKTTGETRFGRFFWSNYILVLHLLVVSGMSAITIIKLPGTEANGSGDIGKWYGINVQVGDISAAIAAGLVLVRMTATSWSSMVAWRCVYMLLEKDTLDLRQLNSMISWKLPRPREFVGWIKGTGKEDSTVQSDPTFRIGTAIILLLMWPATLGAPLLTSAVSWTSMQRYPNVDPNSPAFKQNEPTATVSIPAWRAYLDSSNERRDTMIRATSNVGIMTFNTDPLQPNFCRHVVQQDLQVNVTLNVTFPCIKVEDPKWISDPPSAVKTWLNSTNNTSIIGTELFSFGQVGAVVLFDVDKWPTGDKYEAAKTACQKAQATDPAPANAVVQLPTTQSGGSLTSEAAYSAQIVSSPAKVPPRVAAKRDLVSRDTAASPCDGLDTPPDPNEFKGTKYVVIFASVHDGTKCSDIATTFGELPSDAKLFSIREEKDAPCFIAGTVDITAGVMNNVEGKAINTKAVDIQRDDGKIGDNRWVNETLFLLPDVMNMVALTNMTASIRRWQNIPNYTKSVIQYSYSATWDAMDQKFSPADGGIPTRQQVTILIATVKEARVYAWLGINLLFTISGLLQWMLQIRCKRPVVIDTAAVAITTDASLLYEKSKGEALEWRKLCYVTKVDAFDTEKKTEHRIHLTLNSDQKLV